MYAKHEYVNNEPCKQIVAHVMYVTVQFMSVLLKLKYTRTISAPVHNWINKEKQLLLPADFPCAVLGGN